MDLKFKIPEKFTIWHRGKLKKPPMPNYKFKLKIRKHFSIPILFEDVDGENPFAWDGHFLRVGGLQIHDVFHEIAHYLIAPKSRRKYKEFGLGIGFNTDGYCKRIVKQKFADKEEELVCVLQWVLMYNLGYSEYISYTADEQNWNQWNTIQVEKYLTYLKKKTEFFMES